MLAVVCRIDQFMAEIHHVAERIGIGLCRSKHLLALCIIEKLAVFVQKFKRVPLHGIVACGYYNTATGILFSDSDLCSRSRCQADIDHIKSHAAKCGYNNAAHHFSGDSCIASNDNKIGVFGCITSYERCISGRKLDDIKRRQTFARSTADSATYSGNRLY